MAVSACFFSVNKKRVVFALLLCLPIHIVSFFCIIPAGQIFKYSFIFHWY